MNPQKVNTDLMVLVDGVTAGEVSPSLAYLQLKELETMIQNALKSIKGDAEVEIRRYCEESSDKVSIIHGKQVKLVEGRRSYDYSHIPQWANTKDELKRIEDEAKRAADANIKGRAIVDEATGEVITPAVVKWSDPYFVVSDVKR